MKNRDIFNKDPLDNKLRNDGVARITSSHSDNEDATLRYELESFVCEGQYADGLTRILESVLKGLNSSSQPAVWVSGFYGSGKSHLVKMLHHLWTDTAFSDGATARGIAGLPDGVRDLLRELSTQGRRYGGLHAASGTLPSGGSKSVRMAVLGIICQSVGLPAGYAQARFVLWMRQHGVEKKVIEILAQAVPGHIGTPLPDYGYEHGDPYASFIPAVVTNDPDNRHRAVVIVPAGTPKGTERSPQEYAAPLLTLTGDEYHQIPFWKLHEMICDLLRNESPRVVAELFDGTSTKIIR